MTAPCDFVLRRGRVTWHCQLEFNHAGPHSEWKVGPASVEVTGPPWLELEMTAHEALRADFHRLLRAPELVNPSGWDPARIADRLVHLVVLHGLLPETDPQETP